MLDTSEPIYSDELTDLAEAISPRLTQPSHAKRAGPVIKTGRLALSPGVVAWICSISIHGAVLGAGVWIATSLVHHAALVHDWGGGGGSSGGLVSGQMQSQIVAGPLPSGLPVSGEPRVNQPQDMTADVDFRTDEQNAINLGTDASTDGAPIGIATTSNVGQPHFGRHRPAPGGAVAIASKSAGAESAAITAANQLGDSAPGLPGSLLGSGPPAPDYPAESKRLGEQGTVRVAIEVLPNGAVGRIYVASDPGFPRLRDASLKAAGQLRRYKLTPAFKGGKPFTEVIVIPYKFNLK